MLSRYRTSTICLSAPDIGQRAGGSDEGDTLIGRCADAVNIINSGDFRTRRCLEEQSIDLRRQNAICDTLRKFNVCSKTDGWPLASDIGPRS